MRENIPKIIWDLLCASMLTYWLYKTVEKIVDFFR
jgi:hypothetical protein